MCIRDRVVPGIGQQPHRPVIEPDGEFDDNECHVERNAEAVSYTHLCNDTNPTKITVMKYFIRSLKYFVALCVVCVAILALMLATGTYMAKKRRHMQMERRQEERRLSLIHI